MKKQAVSWDKTVVKDSKVRALTQYFAGFERQRIRKSSYLSNTYRGGPQNRSTQDV